MGLWRATLKAEYLVYRWEYLMVEQRGKCAVVSMALGKVVWWVLLLESMWVARMESRRVELLVVGKE